MTESQFFRCRADDMDNYIARVSLLEQKVHQLSAELEKERENVRIMYDDNVNNEQILFK